MCDCFEEWVVEIKCPYCNKKGLPDDDTVQSMRKENGNLKGTMHLLPSTTPAACMWFKLCRFRAVH